MRASSPICLALTHSARQGRATPFKEKKSSFRGRKRLCQKSHSDRYFNNHEFENYYCLRKKSWRKSEGEMRLVPIRFIKNLRIKELFIKKVKMADNLGPNGLVVSAENEQVQYLQKIALRAENKQIQSLS